MPPTKPSPLPEATTKDTSKPQQLEGSFGVAPRHELSMALRRAYMRLHRDTCAQCAQMEVTADQYVMMNVIKSAGKATQTELVVLIDSDANTVSAMLRRLQQRGLIERQMHASDSRAKVVRLTTEGEKTLSKLETMTLKNRREMENTFTKAELTQLVSLLRRLASYEVPEA